MRIETERLILREIDAERDFEGWARTHADEEIVRFLDELNGEKVQISEKPIRPAP